MNIVITGGSRGMGRSIVERLHQTHTCIVLARASKELDEMKAAYNCSTYVCDVTQAADVTQTITAILQTYGSIDVLINSAGVWMEGPLEENDLATIQTCVETNILGTIYATHAVLPSMKHVGRGMIINIGSQAGLKAKKNKSVYTATKWAITGFSRSLEEEVGSSGIRVTTLYPGTTDTQFFARAGNDRNVSGALKPESVAEAIEWLINLPPSVTIPEFGIKQTGQGPA